MTDAEILAMDSVPIIAAAKYIDVNAQALRMALQYQRVTFGFAVQCAGGRWTYHISPGGLVKYKREGMVMAQKEELA